ncbi:hypothetical protein [Sulfurimonas sp.]
MEDLDKFKESIDTIEDIKPDVIDVSFISNSNNIKSRLINNDDDNFTYKLNNKAYDFQLSEPIYIEKILLQSTDDDLKNMVLDVFDYFTNEKIRIPIENYKGYQYIAVKVNRVIKSFTLKPPKRIFKIKLKSIELFGYSLDKLSHIEKLFTQATLIKEELSLFYSDKTSDIENKIESLATKETKTTELLSTLESDISDKKTEISDLNSELIELKSSLKTDKESYQQLTEKISKLKLDESNLNKSLTDIKNNIQEREAETSSLNTQISTEKEELRKLLNDKNIFAYELQEFLKQGSSNIVLYTIISIIPMALIVFLTYILLTGTVDLTTIYSTNQDMNIMTIFWSRLPFVLVITSIIFVCYEITKIFFKKVMEIHHQKLNFSKIGIISKDVANTSFVGLELNDNEKFELRTKLKMQLLREYLSNEFHIEHDYDINKSLFTRFKNWLKKKDEPTKQTESLKDNLEENTEES